MKCADRKVCPFPCKENRMRAAVPEFPQARLQELADHYASAVAAKRRRISLGFALLVAATLAAGWMGDVSLWKFSENFWRFPAYFASTAPKFAFSSAWADLSEWFWGLRRWLRLLGDTLLIAYVGTLAGTISGFALCFLASANLVRSRAIVFVTR